MGRPVLLLLIMLLAYPCLASAEIDTDLRFKSGTTTGIDDIEFKNAIGHGANKSGTNDQAEVVFSRPQYSRAGFAMAIGLFHRRHSGEINDLSVPINVDYSVTGMSIAPGVRVRIIDSLNVEVKFEFGLGNGGQVTLNSPGISWNATKEGKYVSGSLIVGVYYLFESSSIQLGVEVGSQEFQGDFEIWSNSSGWSSGNVTGQSRMINVVCGLQF